MNRFHGKVALVTGASSGIGRATALLMAAQGASVVVSARREAGLDRVVGEITASGGRAAAVAGDVRDEAVAKRAVDVAVDRFGGLDIAVNNAGSSADPVPTHEMSIDAWCEAIDTHLTAAFLGARHQVPAMIDRGGGSLLFTSSFVGARTGFPGMAAYAAAKAGLLGLVRVLAVELGPKGIRANAVLPGGVDTPSNVVNAPGATPGIRAFVEGLHALKRLAKPEEIARTILHLASDEASFVTGAAIAVDGGLTVTKT